MRTSSGGRWLFILSLMMKAVSASASSDVAAGLTELSKCGDGSCTFWLDANKTMFKTGESCTCTELYLNDKGIAKIAKGTWSDLPNLGYLYLEGKGVCACVRVLRLDDRPHTHKSLGLEL